MKVKISYKIIKEDIVDMSCTTYCKARANIANLSLCYPFPIGSYDYDIEIADEESEKELDDYFLERKNKK